MKLILIIILLSCCSNSFSQGLLSREQALADIRFYQQTLEEVHYNPYLQVSRHQYEQRASALRQSVTDSISHTDLILLLYRLSALLQDGHTSPHILQSVLAAELRKPQFFPYGLIEDRGHLFVPKSSAAAMHVATGSEIVSINAQPVPPLLAAINDYSGGHSAYRAIWSEKLFSYFLLLHDIRPPFVIGYTHQSKRIQYTTIDSACGFGLALSVKMPHIRAPYAFHLINGRLGYIDFRSMSGDINSCNSFMDSCFSVLKKQEIRELAIDLRQNSGGNSLLADLLLSYITNKKYLMMGGRKWKVSKAYKDYLLAEGDSSNTYLQQPDGSTWQWSNCVPEPNKFVNTDTFTGKVYLVTGPFTFSSANMLADGARQFKLATLIGTPTGEPTTDFGETYTFELPNSHIRMQVSTSFDIGADCKETDPTPVQPDIRINESLQDRLMEKDKVIDYILQGMH